MAPYFNRRGYSDVHPYKLVRMVSRKTAEIRRMEAELDPDWRPEMVAGGFSAHCINNHTQRSLYEESDDQPIRVRLHKDGWWRDANGCRYEPCQVPQRFHDYNF